ncbi:MAG: DUF429 domain-containing protein [Alphaproteobacteria bacterium]
MVVTPSALIGVDGAKAGWISAWKAPGDTIRLKLYADFSDLMREAPDGAIILADMPLGLSDITEAGGRLCERECRAFLKGKTSSVFSTPSRAALEAATREKAGEIVRRDLPHRIGVTLQLWNIRQKILELDAALAGNRRPVRILETHPEAIFATLNGGAPALATRTLTADSATDTDLDPRGSWRRWRTEAPIPATSA